MLGVEPTDAGLTKSAKAMDGVVRAKAGVEYALVGDAKTIDSAIVSGDCTTIQASCAAKLGAQLGAAFAIAGKLDRRGTHVELTLALVDVEHKARIRSVTQSGGGDPKKLAKLAYERLVGGDVGDLLIEANAEHGDVLIDDQVVAGLFGGKATITDLARGNHILAIRAKGFKPFRVDIAVEATTHQTLLLDPE
ncbi:MAG: hypothetical protein JO257_17180 [Deltaproteobacteria bacterium]|nr:hypothetical protein [Deltaproteobacteria bacterium]